MKEDSPNILSNLLFQGAKVTTSDLRISFSDLTCLLLVLALLGYSAYIFYAQWKKNYQMPEGAFFFEEKFDANEKEFQRISPEIESKFLEGFSPRNKIHFPDSKQRKVL